MELSVAYQGGGARVIELMAAVYALQEMDTNEADFRVVRVSGASAGAIAAAMHYTGCDITAIINGASALKPIVNRNFSASKMSRWYLIRRFMRGKAIYEEAHLKDLLIKIFEIGGVDARRPIKDLGKNQIELRIMRSDIRFHNCPFADETSETPLVSSLIDSCAIPFAFRVPGPGVNAQILDGGLFNNLPARAATQNLRSPQIALAFSFDREQAPDLDNANFKVYAGAIINSMLSEREEDASTHIKRSNIIHLPNRRGTLDFATVFRADLASSFSETVGATRRQIEQWRRAVRRHGVVDYGSDHPKDVMEQTHQSDLEIASFCEAIGDYKFQAESVHHEAHYYSFDEHEPDKYDLHVRLKGARNLGLQFLRFYFYDPKTGPLKRPVVKVTDVMTGEPRTAMVLPIRSTNRPGVVATLLCLDRPLAEGDEILISKREENFSGMNAYTRKGLISETLGLQAGKSADEYKVSAHFPIEQEPDYYRDADPRRTDFEAAELRNEAGLHVPTVTTRSTRGDGWVTIESVAKLPKPTDRRRFVKLVYGKTRPKGGV